MQASKNNKNRAMAAGRKKVKASDKEEQFGGLRAALLRAALEQSSAMGRDSSAFRELARRLGVTTAAPYYHFRDKEELLLQLAVEGFNKLLHRIEQATGN
jgi:AcrR family transcriptional regulator